LILKGAGAEIAVESGGKYSPQWWLKGKVPGKIGGVGRRTLKLNNVGYLIVNVTPHLLAKSLALVRRSPNIRIPMCLLATPL